MKLSQSEEHDDKSQNPISVLSFSQFVPSESEDEADGRTGVHLYLLANSFGKRETGIELHHLVKLKNPKLVVTALEPMSDAQQSRLFRLMDAYTQGLGNADFVPSPGLQCASCEFFNECRAWH